MIKQKRLLLIRPLYFLDTQEVLPIIGALQPRMILKVIFMQEVLYLAVLVLFQLVMELFKPLLAVALQRVILVPWT